MKKVNAISLVACGLLLSSSVAFGANTVDSAFKEGKVSGSLALYGAKYDLKDNNADSGYSNANVTVGFETASLYGFNAKAEFKGNAKLGEVEHNDYNTGAPFQNHSLMTEAYVKYTHDAFFASAGRQAIDLEWLGDYNEAVVVGITAIPDTVVAVGYTHRQAESGIDLSEDFTDVNGNKGAYVADIKYTGLKSVEFNPYAYSAPDVADWYGLKTTFTADMFGAVAHYAQSSVEVVDEKDGSIGHLELNTTIKDFTAAVGYITTDKDGGIGHMDTAGDNINPLDSGNKVYSADAKTVYGSIGYTILDIELGALYGQTTFGTNDNKEKELNLTVAYSITEALSTSLLFANVNVDETYESSVLPVGNRVADQNYVLASVEYSF